MGSGFAVHMMKTLEANRALRKERSMYFNKWKHSSTNHTRRAYEFKEISLAELRQRKKERKIKLSTEKKLVWAKTIASVTITSLIITILIYGW